MLDRFHVVRVAVTVVDGVRRRTERETLGHRGRKATDSPASARPRPGSLLIDDARRVGSSGRSSTNVAVDGSARKVAPRCPVVARVGVQAGEETGEAVLEGTPARTVAPVNESMIVPSTDDQHIRRGWPPCCRAPRPGSLRGDPPEWSTKAWTSWDVEAIA